MSTSTTKPKRRPKPSTTPAPERVSWTVTDVDGTKLATRRSQRAAERVAIEQRDQRRERGEPYRMEVRRNGEVVSTFGYLDDTTSTEHTMSTSTTPKPTRKRSSRKRSTKEAPVATPPPHPAPNLDTPDADGIARERGDDGKITGYHTPDGERFDTLGAARTHARVKRTAPGSRDERGEDGLTAEQRVARMPADQLPPVPLQGPPETPKPPPPARGSGLSRIAAGRQRSRETAERYAVNYDPAQRFPDLADHVSGIKGAIAALDKQIDSDKPDPKRDRELDGAVSERVYAAWDAGLPTTAIGSLIGCSGGSARGRALTYALEHKKGAPARARSARTTAPGKPKSPRGSRYADQLRPVYDAAKDKGTTPDALDALLVEAFAIVPTAAIATTAGLTPASGIRRVKLAHELAGTSVPTADERREARATMAVPELPDDDA